MTSCEYSHIPPPLKPAAIPSTTCAGCLEPVSLACVSDFPGFVPGRGPIGQQPLCPACAEFATRTDRTPCDAPGCRGWVWLPCAALQSRAGMPCRCPACDPLMRREGTP